MITATLQLYRQALTDTVHGIRRSLWGIAFLIASFLAILFLMWTVGRAGMAGGFVIGFAMAGLTGWYLSLLEIAVNNRRVVTRNDVQDAMGQYFMETISVMFVFFIPQFLLEMTMPQALWVLIPAACLAFNPVPEMIYQGRSSSLEMIKDSAMFMQQNWPEWMVPHLVLGGAMAAVARTLHGTWDPSWVLEAVQMFGPWFGFMQSGLWGFRLAGPSPALGYVLFAAMFVLAHAFMVFRGHLYRHLSGSSRRGRTWQNQL
jgi:hypothetical protein